MKRYEYRIEWVKMAIGNSSEEQLLKTLNDLGQEGWRLNRLYGEMSLRSLKSWKGGVNLLLEREIGESEANQCVKPASSETAAPN